MDQFRAAMIRVWWARGGARAASLLAALMLGALGVAATYRDAQPPALAATFDSPEDLACAVLDAVAARDRETLARLPLSESEFRRVVWPELPASRREVGLPVGYAWRTLQQNSTGYLGGLLADHGGRRYRLVRVRFDGETTAYPSFRVHRRSRLVVQDAETGEARTLRLFGSVLERNGRYKLFSYVVD